jgi:hypothetical protein
MPSFLKKTAVRSPLPEKAEKRTDSSAAHSSGRRPKEQPHAYNPNTPDMSPAVDEVLDLMPLCRTRQPGKTWFLYPILNGGATFHGGDDPGPDRILLVASGSGPGHYTNFVFCGTVFHENQYHSFEPCYET